MAPRPHDETAIGRKGPEAEIGNELLADAGVPRFLGESAAGGFGAPASSGSGAPASGAPGDRPGSGSVPHFLSRSVERPDPGAALDTPSRSWFEARLAADLSRVRIHTGGRADALARGVGANAFTAGTHVYFRAGAYRPESAGGQRLLAHELVHTLQQDGLPAAGPGQLPLGERSAPAELEAQHLAGNILENGARAGSAAAGTQNGRRQGAYRPGITRECAPVIRRDDGQSPSPAPAPGVRPPPGPAPAPPGAGPTPAPGARPGPTRPIPAGATTTLDRIRELLDTWWVGPLDEYELESLWDGFGDALPAVANANWDLFTRSVAGGAELDDIAAVRRVKEQFKADVKATALGYISSNRTLVVQKLDEMGVTTTGAGGEVSTTTRSMSDEQRARVQETQQMANTVAQAQQTRQLLLSIQVGYDLDPEARPGLIGIATGVTPEEHARDVVARRGRRSVYPTGFNPARRPHHPPFGDEQPAMANDAAVREHYDMLSAIIAGFANANPAIYALVREGRVGEVRNMTPEQAQGTIADSLRNVLVKMDQAAGMLSTDRLDYRDLLPIHEQLRGGAGPSGMNWTGNLERWAVDDELRDYRAREFWLTLGLTSLAAAAFIVANFATFGSATFLVAAGIGLGAAGVQTGRSWERYHELETASSASANDETRLVLEGQVSAAHFQAILESALLFLGMYGIAARGIAPLRAGLAALAEGRTAARMLAMAESKVARRLGFFEDRLLTAVNRARPWSEEPLAARQAAVEEINNLRSTALLEAERVRTGTAVVLSQEAPSLSAAQRAALADNYIARVNQLCNGARNVIEGRFARSAVVPPEGGGYGPRPPGPPPARRPPSGHFGSGWEGGW